MMKKFVSILIICISILGSVYAQPKYGSVTMDEMSMTTYDSDTTANAVVLLNTGYSRYIFSHRSGFQIETTITKKIKILKSDGLSFCNDYITYYEESPNNKDLINSLSGTTYNLENGKIVKTKLSKEYINDEKNGNVRVRKFSMPGAKVGSVIEYKYTIISDFIASPRDFVFQSSVPTLYTKYEFRVPEYYSFSVNRPGYEKLDPIIKDVNERYSFTIGGRVESVTCLAKEYTYIGENLPALKEEPYVWTMKDYITKVSFEIRSYQFPGEAYKNFTTNWENIDNLLLERESFGGDLKKESLFKDEVKKDNVNLQYASELQNMIKRRVKWNESNSFYPKDLKEALKTGLGNSSDINFLLINALKAAGFEAFPVVLSTRRNGKIPLTHASIDALNYVITGVKIDGKDYFTDASAKYGDWNLLPEKCMVSQARKLIRYESSWIDLTQLYNSVNFILCNIKFDETSMNKTIDETMKGNSAYDFKNSYFSAKNADDYIEKLAAKENAQIADFKVSNLENNREAAKVEFIAKNEISLDEDILYVNPMAEKHMSNNPFKSETRVFPIEFDYPQNYMQVIDLEVPTGFEVDELPKSEKLVFGDNDIVFVYQIMKEENHLKMQYNFNMKKILFLPNEYEHLRDFFSKVVAKNSEMVVLKRTSTAAN